MKVTWEPILLFYFCMYLKFFIIKGKQIQKSERWEKKDKMQKSQKPGEKSFKNKVVTSFNFYREVRTLIMLIIRNKH